MVDAFRAQRAVSGQLACSLAALGLQESKALRDLVRASVIRRAGPERYFLDEASLVVRRQLRWSTIARLAIWFVVLLGGALLLMG